ncbi:MAG: hypothetical protein OQL19_15685 [Gammaproteobacteria bacterium]|nr:hypothetical protein [Gammaproteobacteria bacterium]
MNNSFFINLLLIGLMNFIVLSSSYAEVKPNNTVADDVLTQPELEQCNKRTQHLAQQASQLKDKFNHLQAQKETLTLLEKDRNQAYKTIDFHNPTSVNNYNKINSELNQLSPSYALEAKTFNEAVKQYKADINQLRSECNHKSYYKENNHTIRM